MTISRRTTLAGAAAAALGACATAEAQGMITSEAASAWLTRYGAAWEAKDAAAAGLLFTDAATYHEMPFDAPMAGRAAVEAYWARVTEPQSDIRVTHEMIAVNGNVAVAHWHAAFNAGGAAVELDGVFVLTFADAEHVSSLREWWHAKSG